jgi:hypothetical protein
MQIGIKPVIWRQFVGKLMEVVPCIFDDVVEVLVLTQEILHLLSKHPMTALVQLRPVVGGDLKEEQRRKSHQQESKQQQRGDAAEQDIPINGH